MQRQTGALAIAVAGRKAESATGPANLIASLTPGVVFAAGLVLAHLKLTVNADKTISVDPNVTVDASVRTPVT